MPRVFPTPLFVSLLICLDLSSANPADACSVCLPGDAQYSSQGATAGEPGNVSFFLETRGYSKSSGAASEAEGREESRGQRLDGFVSWTPLDRLSLTLDVPFVWTRIDRREDDERSRSSLSGLGDISLASGVVLWRERDVLPSRWLEGRLWLKAPTGPASAKVDGERDPHLQSGTGSWDFGVGLAGVQRLEWGTVYASIFRRWNQEGALNYEYGDVWLATLALEAPLGHLSGRPALDFLVPGLGFDFRYAGYDDEGGERYDDSGGAIVYATPSLRIRLPWGFRERPASLRLSGQLPLGQTWLHGRQTENAVWSVGILAPF